MPVHKVRQGNKVGYQWGTSGRIYFGAGAAEKAAKQGQAAYAAGYQPKKK